MSKLNKEKLLKERAYKLRILKNVNRLFNAQMQIAEGCSFLYRKEKNEEGVMGKAELVTDPNEIQDYIDEEYDEDKKYYYITTKEPSVKALDSFIDRVFGKPKQSINLGGDINVNHATEAKKRSKKWKEV